MLYVLLVLAWVLVGAAVGFVTARRGHWRGSWIVYAIFGPFAVPIALQQRDPAPAPVELAEGSTGRGRIDLLVGFDGSPASLAAARLAVGLFGPRVHRVTLATVLDLETAASREDSLLYPEPWAEKGAARQHLQSAAAELHATLGRDPSTVLLSGEPAAALVAHAETEGYDVLVAGCRGRGLSRALLGSCASRLAKQTTVPVLLVPRGSRTQADELRPASSTLP